MKVEDLVVPGRHVVEPQDDKRDADREEQVEAEAAAQHRRGRLADAVESPLDPCRKTVHQAIHWEGHGRLGYDGSGYSPLERFGSFMAAARPVRPRSST